MVYGLLCGWKAKHRQAHLIIRQADGHTINSGDIQAEVNG